MEQGSTRSTNPTAALVERELEREIAEVETAIALVRVGRARRSSAWPTSGSARKSWNRSGRTSPTGASCCDRCPGPRTQVATSRSGVPTPARGVMPDGRAGRVLMVEDDEALAAIVARHLTAHGLPTDVVASAEEAERRLTRGLRPDLVLLDINLPGETGWSLLRGRAYAAAGSAPRRRRQRHPHPERPPPRVRRRRLPAQAIRDGHAAGDGPAPHRDGAAGESETEPEEHEWTWRSHDRSADRPDRHRVHRRVGRPAGPVRPGRADERDRDR